jgi:hypothetical protein
MNVHDEMSDNEVLRAASESLSAIPMAQPPDVVAIMARGNAHWRRRLSAVADKSVAGAGLPKRVREFHDPAGLQRRLRADGIPASVKFNPANLEGKGALAIVRFKGNPCQEYSGGEGQAQNVVTGGSPFTVGMFVHPSAIPSGAGLQFVASRNVGYATPADEGDLFEWLVQTSPRCIGS